MSFRTWKAAGIASLVCVAAAITCSSLHAQHAQVAEKGAGERTAGAPSGEKGQRLTVPAPAVLLMLVRTTLVALNQANFTGNYTVLHGLGTPDLQAETTTAHFAVAFSKLREERTDLSPVLVLVPELTQPPRLAEDGTLRLAGAFPTQPRISFVIVFKPVAGIWRIEGLSVSARAARPKAALKHRAQ